MMRAQMVFVAHSEGDADTVETAAKLSSVTFSRSKTSPDGRIWITVHGAIDADGADFAVKQMTPLRAG